MMSMSIRDDYSKQNFECSDGHLTTAVRQTVNLFCKIDTGNLNFK